MATYYVSNGGSNSNAGTSSVSPWKTIAHVNSITFNPGDSILFNGGQTFTGGPIEFTSGGTSGSPITVSSYGTGSAIIQGTQTGIYVYDCAGFVLQNLNLTGTSAALTASGAGITVYSDTTTFYSAGLTITNLNISSYTDGISVGSNNSTSGFSNVIIENCYTYGNENHGIVTYGPSFNSSTPYYAVTSITIKNCSCYSNLGSTSNTTSASGFGMALGSVSNGSVTFCTAYNNGINNGYTNGGPVGIMVYASTGVTVSNCVCYNNQSGTKSDGDGLDFDDNTSNCIMEYCIAYNNYGAGILAYNGSGTSYTNNVIRYNMIWGNCVNPLLAGAFGDLVIFSGGTINAVSAYNNTVVSSITSANSSPIWLSGTLTNVILRNNIFYQVTSSGKCAYSSSTAYTTSQVLFQGNDYYCSAGLSIHWYSNTYTTLATWQSATSQEKIGSTATGYSSNPSLVAPTTSPTVASPYNLTGANGLKMPSSSALAGAGLNLITNFGINPGITDFWGTVIKPAYSIGATQPGTKGSFMNLLIKS
jgi:hypothetical protein